MISGLLLLYFMMLPSSETNIIPEIIEGPVLIRRALILQKIILHHDDEGAPASRRDHSTGATQQGWNHLCGSSLACVPSGYFILPQT